MTGELNKEGTENTNKHTKLAPLPQEGGNAIKLRKKGRF